MKGVQEIIVKPLSTSQEIPLGDDYWGTLFREVDSLEVFAQIVQSPLLAQASTMQALLSSRNMSRIAIIVFQQIAAGMEPALRFSEAERAGGVLLLAALLSACGRRHSPSAATFFGDTGVFTDFRFSSPAMRLSGPSFTSHLVQAIHTETGIVQSALGMLLATFLRVPALRDQLNEALTADSVNSILDSTLDSFTLTLGAGEGWLAHAISWVVHTLQALVHREAPLDAPAAPAPVQPTMSSAPHVIIGLLLHRRDDAIHGLCRSGPRASFLLCGAVRHLAAATHPTPFTIQTMFIVYLLSRFTDVFGGVLSGDLATAVTALLRCNDLKSEAPGGVDPRLVSYITYLTLLRITTIESALAMLLEHRKRPFVALPPVVGLVGVLVRRAHAELTESAASVNLANIIATIFNLCAPDVYPAASVAQIANLLVRMVSLAEPAAHSGAGAGLEALVSDIVTLCDALSKAVCPANMDAVRPHLTSIAKDLGKVRGLVDVAPDSLAYLEAVARGSAQTPPAPNLAPFTIGVTDGEEAFHEELWGQLMEATG